MSPIDDITTQCLQLLHRAGLANAELIRPLSRQMLADRLAAAGRDFGISPGMSEVSLEELVDKVQTAAGNRWAGELTYTDLHDLWRDIPGTETVIGSKGLPGIDDSPVWGRDRDLDEAALPGEDDFRPWGDDRGETSRSAEDGAAPRSAPRSPGEAPASRGEARHLGGPLARHRPRL